MTEQTPDRPSLYECVWQAWHGTDEPWAGCADSDAIERVVAVVRASGAGLGGTSREQAQRAWDEGYRTACADHSTWCRRTDGDHGQHHINPYRTGTRRRRALT